LPKYARKYTTVYAQGERGVTGAAHRIRYFDAMLAYMRKKGVLFWSGEQIHDWYRGAVA